MKCGPNCRRGHCLDVFTHTVSDRRVSKYTLYPPGGSTSTHPIGQEGQVFIESGTTGSGFTYAVLIVFGNSPCW